MGTAASSPAGAACSPADLTARFFAAQAVPHLRDRIIALSSDPRLREIPRGTVALAYSADDPAMAALKRAALLADPKLGAAEQGAVASGVTATTFWGAYFQLIFELSSGVGSGGGAGGPDLAATAATPADDTSLLLFVCQEVFVYKVPLRAAASGHVAASWGLDKPLLEGTFVRVTATDTSFAIAVWQRGSGGGGVNVNAQPQQHSITTLPAREGHKLVAVCEFPVVSGELGVGHFVEPSLDSSRYFVLRVKGAAGGGGLLGLGFREREDAFSFKSSLAEHVAHVSRQRTGAATAAAEAAEAAASNAAAAAAAAATSMPVDGGGGWAHPSIATIPAAPVVSTAFSLQPGQRIVVALPSSSSGSRGAQQQQHAGTNTAHTRGSSGATIEAQPTTTIGGGGGGLRRLAAPPPPPGSAGIKIAPATYNGPPDTPLSAPASATPECSSDAQAEGPPLGTAISTASRADEPLVSTATSAAAGVAIDSDGSDAEWGSFEG